MNLKLKFSDGTYKHLLKTSKRKLGKVNTLAKNKKGICRVEYTRTYYNEFEFDGRDEFLHKLMPCIDNDLVKEFSNV